MSVDDNMQTVLPQFQCIATDCQPGTSFRDFLIESTSENVTQACALPVTSDNDSWLIEVHALLSAFKSTDSQKNCASVISDITVERIL